jgi:hypothetical protein
MLRRFVSTFCFAACCLESVDRVYELLSALCTKSEYSGATLYCLRSRVLCSTTNRWTHSWTLLEHASVDASFCERTDQHVTHVNAVLALLPFAAEAMDLRPDVIERVASHLQHFERAKDDCEQAKGRKQAAEKRLRILQEIDQKRSSAVKIDVTLSAAPV